MTSRRPARVGETTARWSAGDRGRVGADRRRMAVGAPCPRHRHPRPCRPTTPSRRPSCAAPRSSRPSVRRSTIPTVSVPRSRPASTSSG
ncbi:hypothetical protein FTX61_14215 [Nitriliruptoraceae bacterium ZYF776]|nr:hypothetical protein [Profundirhabdus halotolerans]